MVWFQIVREKKTALLSDKKRKEKAEIDWVSEEEKNKTGKIGVNYFSLASIKVIAFGSKQTIKLRNAWCLKTLHKILNIRLKVWNSHSLPQTSPLFNEKVFDTHTPMMNISDPERSTDYDSEGEMKPVMIAPQLLLIIIGW